MRGKTTKWGLMKFCLGQRKGRALFCDFSKMMLKVSTTLVSLSSLLYYNLHQLARQPPLLKATFADIFPFVTISMIRPQGFILNILNYYPNFH